jgi:hypothetical protein
LIDAVEVIVDAGVRDLGFAGFVAVLVGLAEGFGGGLAVELELLAFAGAVTEGRERTLRLAAGSEEERTEKGDDNQGERVFQAGLRESEKVLQA